MNGEDHNKYLSWAFLGHGLFYTLILGGMFLFFALMFIGVGSTDPDFPAVFIGLIFSIVFLINLAFIAPSFVAYYAIKNRKPWARIAAIVASVLAAMNVPIGTAVCVYALWFFLGEDWKTVYGETRRPGMLHDNARWYEAEADRERDNDFAFRQPPDWR